MLLYILGIVAAIKALGFWQADLLKDTILWFCFAPLAMMLRFATAANSRHPFRKVVKENLRIVILLEFLVNTYTFALIVELILVPLVTIIAMIDVFARMKDEHASVAILTTWVQAVLGLTILGIAIGRAIANWQNIGSLATLRSVTIAPLLSLSMLPFMYLMLVFLKYELVFLRLNLGADKAVELKGYARSRIMFYANLRLKRLEHLLDNHAVDLMHVQTQADVDEIILNAKTAVTFATNAQQESGQEGGKGH
jgi:hypothetical protein